jgi:hypothetical protein
MKNISIYFSNSGSDVNKNIIKYFRSNISILNKAGLVFSFNVARKEDADKYKNMGINDFPTLVADNNHMVGINKINAYLKNYINMYNQKKNNRTESDELADYWKSTIGNVKIKDGKIEEEEDDETDDIDNKIQKNLHNAVKQRSVNMKASPFNSNSRSSSNSRTSVIQSGGSYNRSNKSQDISPSTILKNMNSSGEANIDDELMANFFENQQETII